MRNVGREAASAAEAPRSGNAALAAVAVAGAGEVERAADAPREAAAALELLGGDGSDIHWRMIELALNSGSDLAIIALQDVLGLDGPTGRMNTPGTITNNWNWRYKAGDLTPEALDRLATMTATYKRTAAK